MVDKASCGLGCAPWGGASLRSLDLLAGSSSASLLVPDGVTEGGGSGCCGGCLAGGDAGLSGGWLAGAEVSCCCRWGSTVPPDSTVKSPIGRVLVEPTACTDVEGSRAAEGRETAPAMCLSPGADVGAGAAERGCCGLRLLLKVGADERGPPPCLLTPAWTTGRAAESSAPPRWCGGCCCACLSASPCSRW